MTYGAEAVIPLETSFPTLRTSTFLLPPKTQTRIDANVKLRPLASGDLVLRKVLGNTKNPAWGKLGPNWEEPYRVTSVAGIDAYCLEDLDEKTIPSPWNVNNLRRYYY